MKTKYIQTHKISKLLSEIEALRMVFDTLPVLPHIEENLRREALLKSSLYSARIEGNPLTLEQVSLTTRPYSKSDIKKIEVFNLLKAYKYVYAEKIPKKMSIKFIRNLHRIVMHSISADAGSLRAGPGAIFNQAGVAIYLAPAYSKLTALLKELINIHSSSKYSPPENAAITHFLFEKIHPFPDGNGRVGRLLAAYTLRNSGYGLKGLVSFEEFVDKNRQTYYQRLEPVTDVTLFVEFFLESLITQAKLVLDKLKEKTEESPEDVLLPRRKEILNLIKDHPYCSFDTICRRFQAVNPKTLHYDLSQLQRHGFVQKVGVSKGAVYKSKKS